jgi:hypothetical protein
MSNPDTWRVQCTLRGIITHGSTFPTLESACDYFDALQVPGTTELQVRKAGKRKFITLKVKSRSQFAGT